IRSLAIQAGLKLVDCPIRHLGTEKAHELYLSIQTFLAENGVEMIFGRECSNLIIENDVCTGVITNDVMNPGLEIPVSGDTIVLATGRRGAEWLEQICSLHNIFHQPGTVDIGVRVEVRNEIMEHVNNVLYESKLVGYPKPFKNKVRTF
ncbi:MAG TPA: FAD-dependent oxidoreductase, partial [Clostridiales bacterium]|nr:FAD-dependent oxidoreductase [Clostridiales bacterium]